MARLSSCIALFIALFYLARADKSHTYKYGAPAHSPAPCGKHTVPVTPTPAPCGCHGKPHPVPTVSAAPSPIVTSKPSTPAPSTHVCRYKFCNGKHTFTIGKATDKSFTKSICDLKGKRIGTVDESGQAKLIIGTKLVDISKWSPYGLKQKFDPTFFKTFAIYKGKHAGVGHQTMQQNQKDFLKTKKCWILPFKAFQILDKYGNAVEKHTNDIKDCVKFCTYM